MATHTEDSLASESERGLQTSSSGPESVISPPALTRLAPSNASPIYDPIRSRTPQESIEQTKQRVLPSRALTANTIDDAYIQFILYYNPSVPLTVDTSQLRNEFRRGPDRNDQSFIIFSVWEQYKKLKSKEIRSWWRMAIELGAVRPSDTLCKRNATKYAYHLKKWMHKMHIDDFFDYCLGDTNINYTLLSNIKDNRDGVSAKEDLALRALVPGLIPERKRKRAAEGGRILTEAKQRRLNPPPDVFQPGSPFTGLPAQNPPGAARFGSFSGGMEETDSQVGSMPACPSEGTSGSQHSQSKWRLWRQPAERVLLPKVRANPAIASSTEHNPKSFNQAAEPYSGVAVSSGHETRLERCHCPAVSSPSPSNHGSGSGTGGQSPNQRTLSRYSFYFPAGVNYTGSSHSHGAVIRTSPAKGFEQCSSNHFNNSPPQQSPVSFPLIEPSRPQLHVPPRRGAPARFTTSTTPIIDSVSSTSGSTKKEEPQCIIPLPSLIDPKNNVGVDNSSTYANRNFVPQIHVSFDKLVGALSSELLHGHTTGRSAPLNAEEAREIAQSVVASYITTYIDIQLELVLLMVALTFGLGQHFGYPGPTDSLTTVNFESVPTLDTPDTNKRPEISYTITRNFKHGSGLTMVKYADRIVTTRSSRLGQLRSSINVIEADSSMNGERVESTGSSNIEITLKQLLARYTRKFFESVFNV